MAKSKAVKQKSEKLTTPVVAQITPAHGNGKLNAGGTPGHKGGGGRPLNILRQRAAFVSWKAMGQLNARMSDPAQAPGIDTKDLTAISALAARYIPVEPPQVNVGIGITLLNGPSLEPEEP